MILNLRQKRNIVGILLIAMLFSTVSGFLYPNNKQVKAESDTTEKKHIMRKARICCGHLAAMEHWKGIA